MRHLVGRTVAQQIMSAVQRFTAPFRCALRTRAGAECVVHIRQTLTEAHPDAIVLHQRPQRIRHGVDAGHVGSSAESPGGDQILSFFRLFYGSQSSHLWKDDAGVVHTSSRVKGRSTETR